MSVQEFRQWLGFARIEPFGMERGDVQAARIAQTIANRHRNPDKERPYPLSEFLLDFTPKPSVSPQKRRMTTPQEHKEFFRRLTLAMGGRVITKEEQEQAGGHRP